MLSRKPFIKMDNFFRACSRQGESNEFCLGGLKVSTYSPSAISFSINPGCKF